MNLSDFPSKLLPILKGRIEHAVYKDSPLSDYRGNPLIAALPPIYETEEVAKRIASFPDYDPNERNLSASLRHHCVMRIAEFVQPLSVHLDVESRFSRMIRHGYKARNPLGVGFVRRLRNANMLKPNSQEDQEDIISSSASGFSIIGISGIGKSTTVARNLLLYPQVIVHSKYEGRNLSIYQVVWLKLECPHDGSTKSLCLNFFQAIDSLLGTNYFEKYKRNTENILIPLMARVASLHCLGVLVIDEIQNLSEAKSGGSNKMLNFFVQLVNTIGVPVVLVGTFKATYLLSGEFRKARRGTGQQGGLISDRMKFDDEWDLLLEGLWDYQWTSKPTELTVDLKRVIYEESQGITDIAVKLYMLAQWRAISTGQEEITPALIKSVANDSLRLVKPALDALKQGKEETLRKFGDVHFPIEELEEFYKKSQNDFNLKESLDKLKGSIKKDQQAKVEKITEISSWLMQAGIDPAIAEKVSEQVVRESELDEISTLKQNAFSLCCGTTSTTDSAKGPLPKHSALKPAKNEHKCEPGDLRIIFKKGQKSKIPSYESLVNTNYVKKIEEFFTG